MLATLFQTRIIAAAARAAHSSAAQFNAEPVQNKPMLLSRDWLRLTCFAIGASCCQVRERETHDEREHGIDYGSSNLCHNFPYAAILVLFSI
jgi:hypothetical protein